MKKRNTSEHPSLQFFAGFLLFLLFFEIMTVSVVLSRALRKSNIGTEPPQNEEESTQNMDPTLPPADTPVFSGGILPTPPHTTPQTQVLDSTLDSQFVILLNAKDGAILAQKDADIAFSPASMTKVMTLIVACENLTTQDLERKLPFTEEIHEYITSGHYKGTQPALPTEVGGISCYGDTYRIRDLLYGIGMMSAADCTYMIVKEIAGTEEAFVALMNSKAAELGLTATHFDNAVGFESENNMTTAKEMAVIMAYAMQSDLITDILKPRTDKMPIPAHYMADGVEKTYNVWFTPSLQSRIDKYPSFSLSTVRLDASKTGYTSESFIVCAATHKQTGEQYIAVLGNAQTAHTTITEKFKATMVDLELLYNQYVP